MTVARDLISLYDIDDYQWLEETIELLKLGRLDELDIEHLIEELEALAKKDRATVKSLLRQIIIHILLLQYWSEEYDRNSNHWRSELINFRDQLEDLLTTNLTKYLSENLEISYQKAVKYVYNKTDNRVRDLPEQCPYTLEELLDSDWLP
ncbi:MAG: DUF29 domain-containing protein [Spirulina sp.]